MNFFFDRNIAIHLVRMLDAYDIENAIRHLDDDARFDATDKDEYIIKTVAEDDPRPVFITADVNMYTRNPNERRALAGSGLTCVFIKKGFHNQAFHQQAVNLLKIWPDIVRDTTRCRVPTAFEMTPAAKKLYRLYPTVNLDS